MTATRLLAALLGLAAAGLQAALLLSAGPGLSPGPFILVVACGAVLFLRPRTAAAVGLVAGILVLVASAGTRLGEHLSGAEGGAVLAARLLEVLALGATIALAGYGLARWPSAASPAGPRADSPRGRADGRRADWGRRGQIAAC
ncbi:hypothetical protein [Nocardioides insulae]|uniref:hypothetical protein n=1 Tax=Nocardioides insulae TaxID=394734 RepID=UPI0012FCC20D|nr:hypothetical protein [Nocardioides insulae]